MRMKRPIFVLVLALLLATPAWAQISFIAEAHNNANSAAPAVTHGLTLVNDDVLIALVHTNNSTEDITDNNGAAAWTSVFGEDGLSGTHSYRIFRRVVDGTEGSAFTFAATSNHWGLIVMQWRGVDTASIFDVTPSATTSNNGGSDSTPIGNDITVAANTVGIFVAMCDNRGNTFSAISDSYIERSVANVNPGNDTAGYSKAYVSGQATTTIQVTYSATAFWDSQHFSINEAGAPPAVVRPKVTVY